jgi:glycosyltransferase involved in cell wall biosynthesis
MLDTSVIICAHNPRPDYLRCVLNALRGQILPKERWELLIVDNASKVPLASTWDFSWHPNSRCFLEDELGLAFARQRGMREASADLLVFVDDDNVMAPDYLSEAIRIKREWPLLGVWGCGATVLEFESLPPDYLKDLLSYLGLRQAKNIYWSNVHSCLESMPWGAGLCVRANVAAAYCKFFENSSLRLSGRRGKSLMSAEDMEICYVACNAGLGMGVFPELRVTHLIPKERIAEKYLLKLVEGNLISTLVLTYKWQGTVPSTSVRRLLSILKCLFIRRGLDRKLYLTNLRAAIEARRLIDASRTPCPAPMRAYSTRGVSTTLSGAPLGAVLRWKLASRAREWTGLRGLVARALVRNGPKTKQHEDDDDERQDSR